MRIVLEEDASHFQDKNTLWRRQKSTRRKINITYAIVTNAVVLNQAKEEKTMNYLYKF